jgi:hypothetical protein
MLVDCGNASEWSDKMDYTGIRLPRFCAKVALVASTVLALAACGQKVAQQPAESADLALQTDGHRVDLMAAAGNEWLATDAWVSDPTDAVAPAGEAPSMVSSAPMLPDIEVGPSPPAEIDPPSLPTSQIWKHAFGSYHGDEFLAAVDPEGNLYVAHVEQDGDVHLTKYDGVHGQVIWVGSYAPSTSSETDSSITVRGAVKDHLGNTYVTVTTTVTAGSHEAEPHTYRFFDSILKFDATGTPTALEGSVGPAGTNMIFSTQMAVDTDDNLYLAGTSGEAGARSFFLARVHADGTPGWQQSVDGEITDMVIDPMAMLRVIIRIRPSATWAMAEFDRHGH